MIVAMILAGGVGSRVGAAIPKQFVVVEGREVLAYTLERFDKHPQIGAIQVVCREGYESQVEAMVARDGLQKVRWMTPGGETFQDSVRAGLAGLEGQIADDDLVLVHYGASPFVSNAIISDAIAQAQLHGNACPAMRQVYLASTPGDGTSTDTFLDRDEVMCLNAPHALRFGKARSIYEEGERQGLLETVDPHTVSLMFALGERVWFSQDSTANIKITTADDLRLFEGWVKAGFFQAG